MKKIIALLVVMLLPLGASAQGAKIAYVNTNEIMATMPEIESVQKQIADLQKEYANELQSMEEDYKRRTDAYIAQQDSLTENIKVKRMGDIQAIQERMNQVYEFAQQEIPKKQDELMTPIRQKIMDAITNVGKEKGYSYVFDAMNFLFIGEGAEDATPFVKTKLGL